MTEPVRAVPAAILAAGLAWSTCGCASLDPADDVLAAQQLVAQRSAVPVDWGPWAPGAVEWQPERPLGAFDAARLALRNHAGLRVSVESIVQARADFVQAHLLPNPVLNLTLGFPVDGLGGTPAMGSLLQPLAALWRRPAAIDAADARLRAAVLGVSNAALQLVAEAELAQARLVFAERGLALERGSRDLAAAVLELVEQRLAQGEASLLERNRSAIDLLDGDTRVTSARTRRDRARRVLLDVCGVAGSPVLPRTDDTPVAIPPWIGRIDERDLVHLAEAQRLDLAASRALIEGAIDATRLAELERIPDVSVGLGYQRNFAGRRALGPALALTIPIFDDGRASVATADSRARAAVAENERIRQGAILEVRRAWVQLQGELETLTRLRDSVLALATETRVLAQRSLDAGILERGAVLDAQRRELRTRLSINATELAAVESFIELERALGGRLVAPSEDRP